MADVVIEKEEMINDEIIEEPPKPKPKKKRNFVFTEKRKIALEKGRIKRLENLKKKKADLAEFKQIKKDEKLNKLKDKVLEEIDEEIEENEEETIKEVKSKIKEKIRDDDGEKIPDDSEGEAEGISDYEEEEEIIYKKKPKRRKKKKKIVYLSSESESDDDNYRVYKRRLKPSKQLTTTPKETIPKIKNKYSNIF